MLHYLAVDPKSDEKVFSLWNKGVLKCMILDSAKDIGCGTMPLDKQILRKKRAENVIASLRIENIHPSERLVEQMRQFAEGKITTAEMLADVRRRYVAVRDV